MTGVDLEIRIVVRYTLFFHSDERRHEVSFMRDSDDSVSESDEEKEKASQPALPFVSSSMVSAMTPPKPTPYSHAGIPGGSNKAHILLQEKAYPYLQEKETKNAHYPFLTAVILKKPFQRRSQKFKL